jgi:AbrB family looped-hinge helix DNA binding protein
MNPVLSEKGQVTIPKPIRDDLDLVADSILDFEEEDGKIVVRKVVFENPIAAWRGKGRLPGFQSVDEYLAVSRDGQ